MKRRLTTAAAALALAGCMVGPDYRSPLPQAPAPGAVPQRASRRPSPSEQPPGPLVEPVRRSGARPAGRAGACGEHRPARGRRQPRAAPAPCCARPAPACSRRPSLDASATYSRQSGDQLGFQGTATQGESYDRRASMPATRSTCSAESAARSRPAGPMSAPRRPRSTSAGSPSPPRPRAPMPTPAAPAASSPSRARRCAIQEQTFDLTRRLFEGGRGTALETGQAGALLEQVARDGADAGGAAPDGAVPAVGPDRTPARRIPARGRRLRDRRRRWRGRFRSATARRCSPAAPTSARPSASSPPRRRGSASPPPPSIPTVTLGGSVGSSATSLSGLGSSNAFRFSLGPLISLELTNLVVGRARDRQAEASAEGALANFEGTWLQALEETESALTRYARELDRREALRRGTRAGRGSGAHRPAALPKRPRFLPDRARRGALAGRTSRQSWRGRRRSFPTIWCRCSSRSAAAGKTRRRSADPVH